MSAKYIHLSIHIHIHLSIHLSIVHLDRFIDIHSFLFIDFRFVNQILFKLPSVHGDFKTYCLEILYSRVEQIPNLFTELRTKGLKDILTHR